MKVSGVAWHGDGFYYSRYPAPEKGAERSSRNENHQVYFHRLGTTQAEDELVYQDAANPQRFHIVSTTEDERFAILTISERGKGKDGNAVFVRDLSKGETAFKPLIPTIGDDSFGVIDNVGDALLVETNHGAPNGRVVRIDPARPDESNWQTVLAEKPGTAAVCDDGWRQAVRDVSQGRRDASVRPSPRRDARARDRRCPGLGTAGGFGGDRDDTFVFYTFTSFDVPPAIYRYDLASRQSTLFRAAEIPGFDRSRYETKQVFYPSKDGTRIPMFLMYRKGLALDGTIRRCSTATAGSTSPRRRLSARCVWRCSSRASSTRPRTCVAAANTARRGTRPG